jgi:hypothetical protein
MKLVLNVTGIKGRLCGNCPHLDFFHEFSKCLLFMTKSKDGCRETFLKYDPKVEGNAHRCKACIKAEIDALPLCSRNATRQLGHSRASGGIRSSRVHGAVLRRA